jgi:amino acid adenylation domain-containing protein
LSGLLQDYATEQAQREGDATALVLGAERITYAELETASNRLARKLREVGCGPGDRVCLLAEKSPAAIIAMLATLKAGCAYVPIDTASPAARVARIVRSADPAAALVLGSAAELLEQLRIAAAVAPELPVGALDARAMNEPSVPYAFGPEDVAAESGEPLPRAGSAGDPAHILFTSGSTGDPKGVVITHANVSAFVDWAVSYFGTRPGDRISGHPPLHFDLSTFDIYATFRAGAELHLVPPRLLLPRQLTDFISSSELTQWFCVPSAMTYMAKHGAVPEAGFPTLERVLWCGEVLPTPVLVHWMRRIPQARFTNLYGPTEATIASSYFTVPELPADETAPIPIGVACSGEELLVLGDDSAPLPDGEIGELCIGGAGLSPGYWRDEEKTRAAFVPDPRTGHEDERIYRTGDLARVGDDGVVYFLGRTDSQIKTRGYRVELGEIEAAVNTLPEVAECAVVGIDSGGFEGTAVCCAFAPAGAAEVEVPVLRAQLSSLLPSYMLPSRWKSLSSLPKNVNGKIDRRQLRELFSAEAEMPAERR